MSCFWNEVEGAVRATGKRKSGSVELARFDRRLPGNRFQTIGGGLRRPLNGGGDRRLILDVRANVEKFDRDLAFSRPDRLRAP